jgi:hypothetical protein
MAQLFSGFHPSGDISLDHRLAAGGGYLFTDACTDIHIGWSWDDRVVNWIYI